MAVDVRQGGRHPLIHLRRRRRQSHRAGGVGRPHRRRRRALRALVRTVGVRVADRGPQLLAPVGGHRRVVGQVHNGVARRPLDRHPPRTRVRPPLPLPSHRLQAAVEVRQGGRHPLIHLRRRRRQSHRAGVVRVVDQGYRRARRRARLDPLRQSPESHKHRLVILVVVLGRRDRKRLRGRAARKRQRVFHPRPRHRVVPRRRVSRDRDLHQLFRLCRQPHRQRRRGAPFTRRIRRIAVGDRQRRPRHRVGGRALGAVRAVGVRVAHRRPQLLADIGGHRRVAGQVRNEVGVARRPLDRHPPRTRVGPPLPLPSHRLQGPVEVRQGGRHPLTHLRRRRRQAHHGRAHVVVDQGHRGARRRARAHLLRQIPEPQKHRLVDRVVILGRRDRKRLPLRARRKRQPSVRQPGHREVPRRELKNHGAMICSIAG